MAVTCKGHSVSGDLEIPLTVGGYVCTTHIRYSCVVGLGLAWPRSGLRRVACWRGDTGALNADTIALAINIFRALCRGRARPNRE